MRVAVVEDCNKDREYLVEYIKRFAYEQNLKTEISEYTLGENFLEDEDLSTLDVVFLDIYLGKKNGMEVAKILREIGYTDLIIFCTTTARYALEGYSVRAMSYIVKPYTYKEIEKNLKEIAKTINEQKLSIRIKDGREWYKIDLSDILYIENHGNYVDIHTSEEVHSTRMTLNEMQGILLPYNCFTRCDRGIIVNLVNIHRITDSIILMNNNEKIPISRRNKGQVKERYLNFIFEEMEKEDV
ncbi:MAG: LytTR family DNA-binding domain-containing protein [Eubacterium sp.]